jgi:hypothetical protein
MAWLWKPRGRSADMSRLLIWGVDALSADDAAEGAAGR